MTIKSPQTNAVAIEQILKFAGSSKEVLKQAFRRKTSKIAENLTRLGKPIKPATLRKIWNSSEVRRRNAIEGTILTLGAARLDGRSAFERIALFLTTVIEALRGNVPSSRNLDEAMNELRLRLASADRYFLKGELKEFSDSIIYVDYALKGVFGHLAVKI